MKTKIIVCLAMLALAPLSGRGATLGTEFTYQGRLTDGTGPASGLYDFTFTLHLAASGGVPLVTVTNLNAAVSNGLFTATVDFGGGIYNGNAYWISLGVRSNGAGGGFTALTPRQPITPTPYAITAGNLSVALPSANLSGAYWNPVILNNAANSLSGNGSNLTALNASQLASGTVPAAALSNAWKLGGNTGTAGAVLGTVDGQPVVLASGNSRVLSLETKVMDFRGVSSTAVNVLGGANINTIASNVTGATIGGGGSSDFNGFFTVPNPNTVLDAFGTVGGGLNNTAGSVATVAGGGGNYASGSHSFIGGGQGNGATNSFATVAGGELNRASGSHSFIGGGLNNLAAGSFSVAAGNQAKANHNGSFVWADSQNAVFASTAENQFNIRAAGGLRVSGSGGGEIMEVSPGGTLIALGGYFSGDVFVGNNQNFGTTTRQMLNLWGTQYGIGVQGYTMYSRAAVGAGFAWYQGGTHSNAAGDAGGGQTLMSLDSSGAALPGNLTFGTGSLRQMLNLWAGEHGIGVQGWTTYFRTIGGGANGGFAWYQGGVHADNQFDAGGGQTLMNLDSSGLNVAGKVAYTGQLSKLDVAENFEARVRAADLFLGHSGRRGTPGRALVDNADTLHLNFASDWANTSIGGNNVSVCTLTIRGGCDIAEPFRMSGKDLPKGAVVVIDEANPGHLKLSESAYDTRVAGIISGANGVNPGISLSQQGVMEGDQNVALSGRVYVQADASNGAIKPGDLLTTSATPGYAMKVADHGKAQGAILGKAMTGLAQGEGLVLVLVTLQ